MNYDLAVIYFGMTRSLKSVYESHKKHIFSVLKQNNISYQTFMHTWNTNNKQRIFNDHIETPIDINDYKTIQPDYYQIDDQDIFENSICIKDYFDAQLFHDKGDCENGEWFPLLILNHLCSLESQKRSIQMVESSVAKGNSYKLIMFLRPDVSIKTPLPVTSFLSNTDKINIPNENHYEGYNDRFAIMNYENSILYGKRINGLKQYRKKYGRIVSEKYIKYILDQHNIKVNMLDFHFDIIRP
jgi:hypothetical protein